MRRTAACSTPASGMDDGRFMRWFEDTVSAAIAEYKLLEREDNVLVAVSGGKDSTTALYLLHKFGFDVEGVIIDQLLGEHSKRNLENIRGFCTENGIKLHVVHMRDLYGCSVCYMKSVLDGKGIRMNSCTICGVVRRNILNRKARELGANKLVTGHNLDDEVQTLVMNYIRGDMACLARTGPRTGVKADRRFVQRVKPLYFCLESEVRRYSMLKEFPVVYDPCPCSLDSYRTEIKKHLNRLEDAYPGTKRRMMAGFLGAMDPLKAAYRGKTIGSCPACGEPSSGGVCRTCNLISMVAGAKECPA